MKFNFKKLNFNEQEKTFILIGIIILIIFLIISCKPENQNICTMLVILSPIFNFLPRKDDSNFSQIRTPLIIFFAILANKTKTACELILRPENVEWIDFGKANFENTSLVMYITAAVFVLTLGFAIFSYYIIKHEFVTIYKLENAYKQNGKNLSFPRMVTEFAKYICILNIFSGILEAISRPIYNVILTREIDYIFLQKNFINTSMDIIFHLIPIIILLGSVQLFDFSFTREIGDFLITEDNLIIKYKGKNKKIFIPKDFKIFMTDTFNKCDSSYEIHFEEGTTEIPPLKFIKSIPNIQYPSSLTDIREYSLFIEKQNPYNNTTTVNMLLKNPVFQIIDGCLVNTKNNTLVFKIEHSSTEFKIPDGIEKIGKYAFDDLMLGKFYSNDDISKTEVEERIKKYINFTYNNNKEYEIFAASTINTRLQLNKISFNKNIKEVHPEALEMATGLKEIFVPEDCDYDFSEINPTRPYIRFLGKGKKITHRMIERLLQIHEKIKSGCYPNSKQLAYDLETSEPTINRDIEYLRDSRGAPIQYDFTNRGYYYTEDYELFFDK